MNPVALITGSSRGIGRGIALELAKAASHDLVINYAGNEAAAQECKALCEEAVGRESRDGNRAGGYLGGGGPGADAGCLCGGNLDGWTCW